MLVRQLEEELRMRMRGPNMELQQQVELLLNENDHLTREVAILRETIKELELRIETQKQTLQSRDESIKKLLDMLQNKGVGKEEERQLFQQMQLMAQKQVVSNVRNQNLQLTANSVCFALLYLLIKNILSFSLFEAHQKHTNMHYFQKKKKKNKNKKSRPTKLLFFTYRLILYNYKYLNTRVYV
uniref:ERC protein 2 n=1 Tax=Sipha flava TaxID=143950 RepID=A0A2S2PYK2_9HEMI